MNCVEKLSVIIAVNLNHGDEIKIFNCHSLEKMWNHQYAKCALRMGLEIIEMALII